MPTSSSLGMGIAAVPLRISLKTPGAILQPQPPPCERLVRRGWVATLGVGAFMGGVSLIGLVPSGGSAEGNGFLRQFVQHGEQGRLFGSGLEQRRSGFTLCLQHGELAAALGDVPAAIAQQGSERGSVAGRKVTAVAGTEHAHVAVPARSEHRRAPARGLPYYGSAPLPSPR